MGIGVSRLISTNLLHPESGGIDPVIDWRVSTRYGRSRLLDVNDRSQPRAVIDGGELLAQSALAILDA